MKQLQYAPTAIMSAVFLLTFGAMLITINIFGSSIPFYDEWEAEAAFLYKQYEQGGLTLASLFEPHNGHRIFFTRLTSLGLYILNGGWDPELQMVVGALLHAGIATILTGIAVNCFRKINLDFAVVFTIGLFVVPFSWLSITVAFQTQFFYMLFFSLLALIAFIRNDFRIAYFWSALSLLSMTSGAFVLPSGAIVIILQCWRENTLNRIRLLNVGICLAAFVVFVLILPDEPAARVQYAQDFGAFAVTLLATISWPFRVSFGIGLIIYIPSLILIYYAVFRKTKIPLEFFAIAVFIGLQILAMGYFRGLDGVPPPNRYWEILLIGVWINFVCLLYFVEEVKTKVMKIFASIWVAVILIGLIILAHEALTEGLPSRLNSSRIASSLISEYLESGDASIFAGRTSFEVSHPNTNQLLAILSDESTRQVLPSSIGGIQSDNLRLVKNSILSSGWALMLLGLFLLLLSKLADIRGCKGEP